MAVGRSIPRSCALRRREQVLWRDGGACKTCAMRVIVTCGPSYEPIDEVRRLTNFSTGELGIMLANRLTHAGFEVLCFKGVGATCHLRAEGARVIPFSTNASLRAELEAVENRSEIRFSFHAAALCDYRVKSVHSNLSLIHIS